MSIVNKLLNVSKLHGVEQDEFFKANFSDLDKYETMFISFIMGTNLKKVDHKPCSKTELYLGREHFMYMFFTYNKVLPQYLTPNEVKAINILKKNKRIPHIKLLESVSYVMSLHTLTLELQTVVNSASVLLKGFDTSNEVFVAFRSKNGTLTATKKSVPPFNLRNSECVVYTKNRRIAQGGTLLYHWARLGRKVLPPEILKLRKHKSYRQERRGKFNLLLTPYEITSEYIPHISVEADVVDWVIDEELLIAKGVKYEVPIGVIAKSNELLFQGEEVTDLKSCRVILYLNSNNTVNHTELKLS